MDIVLLLGFVLSVLGAGGAGLMIALDAIDRSPDPGGDFTVPLGGA